MSPN